jgi:hypothetical protein
MVAKASDRLLLLQKLVSAGLHIKMIAFSQKAGSF